MDIFYSNVAYVVAVLFISLGAYVYKVVEDVPLKRVFLGLCAAIFTWLFFDGIIYNAHTIEMCWKMNRFASIGYFLIPPLTLHFFLRLTKRDSWLSNRFYLVLMYVPALILIVYNYFDHVMVKDYIKFNQIWYAVDATDSPLYWFYMAYCCMIIPGAIGLVQWRRETKSKREQKQATAMINAVIIIFLIVVISKVISPVLGIQILSMPIFESIIAMILMVAFWVSVVKLRLMRLTPSIAVEEILSKTKDLFILLELDLTIKRINAYSETLLNASAENLVGKGIHTLFCEESSPIQGYFEKSYSGTFNLRRLDGTTFAAMLYFSTLSDIYGESVGYAIVGHDLTETQLLEQEILIREQTEKQLLESKKKYKLVINNVNEGIVVIQNGLIKFTNPRAASFVNVSEDALINMPASVFIHPDDLEWIRVHIENHLTQNNIVERFIFRVKMPDETIFWIENSSVWVNWGDEPAILCFLSDVTDRKKVEDELEQHRLHLEVLVSERTEKLIAVNQLLQEDIQKRQAIEIELRSSEEKFREVFNNSRESILLIRPKSKAFSAQVIEMNDTARNLLGAVKNEKGEILLENYVPAEEKLFYRQAAIDLLAGKKDIWETLVYNSSGALIPVEINARQFLLRGEVVVLMVVRDITDRKENERQVQRYQEKLRSLATEITKVEEIERRQIATEIHDYIGQSLAVAKMRIHDVKNVLGQMENARGEDQVLQVLELINTAIKHTRSLTFELSSPILYELGFVAAVEWLSDKMSEEHHLDIRVKSTLLNEENLNIEMKVFAFKAVRELLFNIVKHAQAENVLIEINKDEHMLMVTVKDNGIGFDRKTNEMNENKEKGFGIFSIRERLMQFEGQFIIDSEIGVGTSVTIGLPI